MTSPIDPTLLALGQRGLEDDSSAARGIGIGLMLGAVIWMVLVGVVCWWLA